MADAEIRTFRSSDGYEWAYRSWPSSGEPRGRVVFVHGIRSHGGWYLRTCEDLAAAGYEVDLLDRRGGGMNQPARGDTPEHRRLLDDIGEFLTHARKTTPGLPVVLGGISWGGKPAAALSFRRPGLIDGLILVAPGFCPRVATPFPRRARVLAARFVRPLKMFPVPLNDPELFTADPAGRAFIDADPLGTRTATARFLYSNSALSFYLKRAVKRVKVPVLLLLAERDRIIDNAATREYMSRFTAAAGVTMIEYPGAEHTLEFEPVRPRVVEDVLTWLNRPAQ